MEINMQRENNMKCEEGEKKEERINLDNSRQCIYRHNAIECNL